jgi:UDP-N-acetylmuramyl pentapeptide phosphotransferase/UDP-N-acetylglucosamine-1-phosphate transferase
MSVPQVTARVFGLGMVLMALAITAALASSLTADIVLLALGAAATGFVLFNLKQER